MKLSFPAPFTASTPLLLLLTALLFAPAHQAQEVYLKASNTDAFDHFGQGVAIDGDTVAIGARSESSNAIGVDGDQGNDSISEAGAVYVFVGDSGSWSQQAYIKTPTFPRTLGHCGYSLALQGDTLAIGEYGGGTGLSGTGTVHIYVRVGETWSLEATLLAPNADAGDWFGYSLELDGDTLLIGAPNENSSATGVDGDQADNNASDAGAAYVFVRAGSTWTFEAYLKASNSESRDLFGWDVAISGDLAVVGSPGDDSSSTGINGDDVNNGVIDAGSAFVFQRSGQTWSQLAYMKPTVVNTFTFFGDSVDVEGTTVVVGAPGEDGRSRGVGGNPNNLGALDSGAVYAFEYDGTNWVQGAYFKASNTDSGDAFGTALDLRANSLLVGANNEKSNALGIDGDHNNDSLTSAGAAYFFEREGSTWGQTHYVKATNTGAGDIFGTSLAHQENVLLIGAPNERSSATGSGGDQSDNGAFWSGAVYLYELDGCGFSASATFRNDANDVNPVGYSAVPAQLGLPWTASLDVGTIGSSAGVVLGFASSLEFQTKFGWLLVNPLDPQGELLYFAVQSGTGTLTFTRDIPDNSTLCGFGVATQAISFGGPLGFQLHNAYDLVLGD